MVAAPAHTARSITEDEWAGLLDVFPDHTVFHTLPWLKTLVASHGLHLQLLAATDGERVSALWPMLETRKGPIRIVGSPLPGWSTAYLGPLFSGDAVDVSAWIALIAAQPLQRASYLAVKAIGPARSVNFSAYGFRKVAEFDTYRIDLRLPKETLWGRLRAVCRNEIRKSQRSGVEVCEETDDSFIEPYWSMTCETFARTGAHPTHSKDFVSTLWKQLHPAGSVRVISAMWKASRVATIVLLQDRNVMYYWASASRLEHRRLCAHRLLLWEAIAGAQQAGLHHFDLISTAGGPGQFKKSFGPDEVTFATHWERSASPFIAAAKSIYEGYVRRRQFGKGRAAWHTVADLAGILRGWGRPSADLGMKQVTHES